MTVLVGMREPLTFSPSSVAEEVMQNVRMILGIRRGSVPLDREFGIDADLLDAPMGVAKARMASDLAKQIAQSEPRARLKALTFTGDAADGTLEPLATIVIEEEFE